jgi:hypothetical protein
MKIIGLVILVLGAGLLFQGLSRQDSLVGHLATVSTDAANSIDGGSRLPAHVGLIVGGGVLLVLGGLVAFRKSAS